MPWVEIDGKQVHIRICNRGQKRLPCKFCGTPTTTLCDYPTPTAKQPRRTCSKRICDKCATHVGDDRDLCPPHAKLVVDAQVPTAVLADPSAFAMTVAVDIVEQATGAADVVAPFVATSYEDWEEFVTERAAIYEYLGGHARTDADRMALADAGARPPVKPRRLPPQTPTAKAGQTGGAQGRLL